MSDQTESARKSPSLYGLLWLVAIVSLSINLIFVIGLFMARARVASEVTAIRSSLGAVQNEPMLIPVHVDEMMALSMTVGFSDTIIVPISNSVAVSTMIPFEDTVEVPINTVIAIDNSIEVFVDIPVVGRVPVPIPIVTNIPINMQVDVPISRNVPVQMDIPVRMMVEVPIDKEIPIQQEIPIVLDFPVSLPLGETSFSTLLDQLDAGLAALELFLGVDPNE